MKKILITGGAGTVGSSFIKEYYSNYEFYNFSRGEEQIADLSREYPKVNNIIGDICNLEHLVNTFETVKPDIVIHAAAIKHVNLAELNPSQTVSINIEGSYNIIKASVRCKIPLTIGISTDKACAPENVYGYSKKMMEMMFMEHHNPVTKFVCTRFANVANSKGSVIPFWKNLLQNNQPLKLTDPNMNRLMFSKQDSAKLIHHAIDKAFNTDKPFVLSKLMDSVNMLDLAKHMSDKIEIVGPRPGEKTDEDLISEKEIPYTVVEDGYVSIFNEKQSPDKNLKAPHSSFTAPKMGKDQLNKLIL
jgi:UDP-N-acetylglucosamine 4,6-dehydratase